MAKGDKPLDPEVITPSGSPSNRVRAYRIRKALKSGENVEPDELKWFHQYEQNRGSSRKHTVEYREETAEAEGTGTAAEVAAAMAAPELAREEGRRYDALINAAVNAINAAGKQTQMAYDMVLKMAANGLARNEQMEDTHIKMLDTIRGMSVQIANAEAEAIIKDAESEAESKSGDDDAISGMMKEMLPALIGEFTKRKNAEKVSK